MRNKTLSLVLLAILALTSVSCAKLQARDNLIKGQQAFKNAKYEESIRYFQEAMNLDPDLMMAELYLGTAYSQQYIPGAQSAENQKNAEMAIKTFESILTKDPNNIPAIAGLAFIYQNLLRLDKAHEYYARQTQLDASNPVPFYAVASVNWLMVSNKAEPPTVEEQIKLVSEGLASADKNLLLREKARLAETEEEKTLLTASADQWFEKALDTRKKNQEKKIKEAQGIKVENQ